MGKSFVVQIRPYISIASECIDEDSMPPNRKSSRPCLGDRSSWHDKQDPSLPMSNCTTSAAVARENSNPHPGNKKLISFQRSHKVESASHLCFIGRDPRDTIKRCGVAGARTH